MGSLGRGIIIVPFARYMHIMHYNLHLSFNFLFSRGPREKVCHGRRGDWTQDLEVKKDHYVNITTPIFCYTNIAIKIAYRLWDSWGLKYSFGAQIHETTTMKKILYIFLRDINQMWVHQGT